METLGMGVCGADIDEGGLRLMGGSKSGMIQLSMKSLPEELSSCNLHQ
jgi:hypothetical protein